MHKFNIENAHYEGDYKIFLAFDDGKEGVVNLRDFLFTKKKTVFERLRDLKQFQDFYLENKTIVWGEDLDLAPEFLHDLLIAQNSQLYK